MRFIVGVVVGVIAGLFFTGNFPDLPTDDAAAAHGPLRVTQPTDGGGYDRDKFGSGWADLDGDGCETRDEILARDLTGETVEDGCDVKTGTLHDPYTGRIIEFTDQDAMVVQIDHIYPLSYAWRMGAAGWSEKRRVKFANDPRNLLAVDGPTNASKGDQGPGEWVPANRTAACMYGRKYRRVAIVYGLPVTRDDLSSIRDLLATCKEKK